MRKLVVMLAVVISLLAVAGVASAEHGNIGGIGVGATNTTLTISK